MRDFPNVFPNDLPSLPSKREIYLPIDLVPGTTPISLPPYRIARAVSRPDSRSDPIAGSEPSSGYETEDWDSLPDFFFQSRTCTCGLWPTLIIIQNII